MRLAGKVALITGGASGMGQSEAAIFAREGARVVVADVLDALGLRFQALGVSLPRQSGVGLLVGRAKTTLWEDVEHDEQPYELELRAVDECQRDEVIVAAAAGSTRSGIWGELLSTAARNRGCAASSPS